MKYEMVEIIGKVSNFKVLNRNLIFEREDKQLFINETLVMDKSESYSFFENNLCYYDGTKTHIFNTLDRKMGTVDAILTDYNYYPQNRFIQTFDRKLENSIYSSRWSIFQIQPLKKIYDLPHRYIGSGQILGDYSYQIFERVIVKSLSLLTGEYEWETPINRSGEIFKLLGIRDNELVVCWKRGEKLFGLLGIDIQTGVIVWNIDNNQLLNGHSLYFTDNQQSLFSTQGTHHNSYFIEIDLLSKQAIRFGEIEDLCKAQVEISRSQYKDGLIYFTASTHHDIFPDIIGVLDYKTLKVLWQHRFDFDRLTHLKNFEVTEDKLYVLDSKDTLHIFDKEQS